MAKWRYLYRAVDSAGATLDFLLLAKLGWQALPASRLKTSEVHD
jgi:transposase-like protein